MNLKSDPKPVDISIIILTWNSLSHIGRCLNSIEAALGKGRYNYEIFLIDNGSTDGTPAFIESCVKKYPDIMRPVFLNKNMGTTYSRNLALRQARGEFIIVMDSDVEIFKGTVEELIDWLRSNPTTGLAAPKLLYGNGMLQKSTDAFPTLWNKLKRYFYLKAIERKEDKAFNDDVVRSVDYAISALWVLRRDVVSKVGMLDEGIFYAPEDVDYCLRIWKAGYKVVYVPYVSAVHHAQEISRGLRINKAMVSHIQGLLYYFRKHGYIFRRPKFADISKF